MSPSLQRVTKGPPPQAGGPGPSDPGTHSQRSAPGLTPGWGTRTLLFAFWTLWGILMASSLLLSPAIRAEMESPSQLLAFGLLGACIWAVITIPAFQWIEKLDLQSGNPVWRYGALVLVGLCFGPLVSLTVPFLSSLFLDEFSTGAFAGRDGYLRVARYRLTHDWLAALLVITAGIARYFFLRLRARQAEAAALQAQLAQSRLAILRAQLDPHFLFNTLNAVAALVSRDPKGVRRIIARLSGLLRRTLEESEEAEIPVARELEMIERYLEILEIRFQGRLETRIEASQKALNALVPNMILQPLVENAMKHGIEKRRGPGSIAVSIRRSADELVLSVSDSGSGSTPESADPTATEVAPVDRGSPGVGEGGPARNRTSPGFGLVHTRERLLEHYGDAASLTLDRAPAGGTVACIRLPYRTTRIARPLVAAPPRSDHV